MVIGGEDLSSNKRVQQVVEVVPEFEREKLLRGLLQKYHGKRDNRVLVFALYKKEAARLEQNLQRAGYACLGIHGDKSQTVRGFIFGGVVKSGGMNGRPAFSPLTRCV